MITADYLITLPPKAHFAHVHGVCRCIYPIPSVTRCYRNTATNQLQLITTVALSIDNMRKLLAEEGVENIEQIGSADQYIEAHPELVAEHPNGVKTATFISQ